MMRILRRERRRALTPNANTQYYTQHMTEKSSTKQCLDDLLHPFGVH